MTSQHDESPYVRISREEDSDQLRSRGQELGQQWAREAEFEQLERVAHLSPDNPRLGVEEHQRIAKILSVPGPSPADIKKHAELDNPAVAFATYAVRLAAAILGVDQPSAENIDSTMMEVLGARVPTPAEISGFIDGAALEFNQMDTE